MITHGLQLADFLRELDAYAGHVPLDELVRRMEALDLPWDACEPFARFNPNGYRRNLMHAGPAYSALLLCWRAGQRSPIHDHRGSSCGVRVVRGVLTETLFSRTSHGCIYATGSHELGEGAVCGSYDQDIHQISNLQPPGSDLVTLHVYSPPLMTMGMYSLTDTVVRAFCDPVHELMHGDGI